MTNTKDKTTAKNTSTARDKNTPHDGLIKKVMENPIAAQEFLEEYLPYRANIRFLDFDEILLSTKLNICVFSFFLFAKSTHERVSRIL